MLPRDIRISLLVGLLAALVWAPVIVRVAHGSFASAGWLLAALPLIFAAGLYLGALLSRWKLFFRRFSRFAMVGVLNSGIDFAVFNFFIYITAIEKGPELVAFKSAAFATALTNSYFWNKYWVFGARATERPHREMAAFAAVTVTGFVINVGITSLVANLIVPPFHLSQLIWDNAAAAFAAAANLAWNFTGYHSVVFRTKKQVAY